MLVDTHTHLYPRRYIERLKSEGGAPRVLVSKGAELLDIFPFSGGAGQAITDQFESVQAKLAFMDQNGIAISMVSVGNPWVDSMAPEEGVRWASSLNAELEEVCMKGQGRLFGLGILPVRDIQASLEELDHVAGLPHLRGVVLSTQPANGHIDNPAFGPLWQKAAALGLPIVLHPHYTVGGSTLEGFGAILHLTYGFTFETTLAVSRLILSGVLEKHPDLQLVAVHAGGALPFLIGRLDNFSRSANLPIPPSEYLRRLYFDGVVYHSSALKCTLDIVGADRLMFGSDHPFGQPDPNSWCRLLDELRLPSGESDLIKHGSASRLFQLPQADVMKG